ncbi:MAG: zinc ribbon domain-containing protein [Acidimicrobiales bacterium]
MSNTSVYCSSCGAQNHQGFQYCAACGAPDIVYPAAVSVGERWHPSISRKAVRRTLITLGVVVVLVAAGAVTMFVVGGQYGPQRPVHNFFTALNAGNAQSAAGQLASSGGISEQQISQWLSVPENRLNRPTNVHVGSIQMAPSGTSATVAVSWNMGNRKIAANVQATKIAHQSHYLVFPVWRLTGMGVTVNINVPSGVSSVTVDGTNVSASNGSTSFTTLPGYLTVATSATHLISAATQTIFVQSSSNSTTVNFSPSITPAVKQEALVMLDKAFASCIAKENVALNLTPSSCPFYDNNSSNSGSLTSVTWKTTASPSSVAKVRYSGNHDALEMTGTVPMSVTYTWQGFTTSHTATDTVSSTFTGQVSWHNGKLVFVWRNPLGYSASSSNNQSGG